MGPRGPADASTGHSELPSSPGSALGRWYQLKAGSEPMGLPSVTVTAPLSHCWSPLHGAWSGGTAGAGEGPGLGPTLPGTAAEDGSAAQLVQGSCRARALSAV